MIKGKKVLAFIPARGNSKGIPGKNLKILSGKPLIAHTIEAAKGCSFFDDIVVSTDSEEIAETARQYGAEVPFLRPEELASDTAKTIDAILYTLERLAKKGREYDYLVLLQPTSPLRRAEDIEGAVSLALESGKDVTAVSEVSDSPILMRSCDEKGNLTPLLSVNSTVRRQDMPKYYRVNGSIYVNEVRRLSAETSLNDNPVGYRMPAGRSVDIDERVDLVVAQYYMEQEESI
ncbi:MAG: acylneuraminate cytidylyltransferase family protein [Lachnospiraceae bacterium]|nr:acylneuraminate cytidylyltransferase family protein [Lachnospiraceae bacterium]